MFCIEREPGVQPGSKGSPFWDVPGRASPFPSHRVAWVTRASRVSFPRGARGCRWNGSCGPEGTRLRESQVLGTGLELPPLGLATAAASTAQGAARASGSRVGRSGWLLAGVGDAVGGRTALRDRAELEECGARGGFSLRRRRRGPRFTQSFPLFMGPRRQLFNFPLGVYVQFMAL